MTFNRYRSARDRRWHPKFSISPRESAPVAHAAITGNALSPAARLMAAAVINNVDIKRFQKIPYDRDIGINFGEIGVT